MLAGPSADQGMSAASSREKPSGVKAKHCVPPGNVGDGVIQDRGALAASAWSVFA